MGFFTDSLGRQTIVQTPNAPILGWALLGAASYMALDEANRQRLRTASAACLTVWAALEVVSGQSGFRRSAGALTLSWLFRRT